MTLLSARQDDEITDLCSLNGNGNDLSYTISYTELYQTETFLKCS